MNVDEILWPSHLASMHIDHNQHLAYYETVGTALERGTYGTNDFVVGELAKCLETGEVWTLQWYPITPVGFCILHASTLSRVLEAALADD